MGRSSDARQRLLAAALALIWEESYGAVSVDDICRQADVRKGSFYHFFPSKSELAIAALEFDWEQRKTVLDRVFASGTPPLDQIRRLCAATVERQRENQVRTGRVLGSACSSVGSEVCHQAAEIRAKICELIAREVAYWESAIRNAMSEGSLPPGDAAVKARCAFAYVEGLIAQARIHNEVDRLQSLPDLVCDHLGVRRS